LELGQSHYKFLILATFQQLMQAKNNLKGGEKKENEIQENKEKEYENGVEDTISMSGIDDDGDIEMQHLDELMNVLGKMDDTKSVSNFSVTTKSSQNSFYKV